MSSAGGPGMLNWSIIPQNALQHDESFESILGAKLKIEITGVRSRVRESLSKWLN